MLTYKSFIMKKITVALSFVACLFIASCGNNNTSTNMPDSGYEPRTEPTNSAPVTTDSLPRGAVGVDSINNGQTNTAGAGVADSANNKKDSAGKK
jgi:hypothetical protein